MKREANAEIEKTERASVAAVPEQTRPGPVYSPAVDIFENDESMTVLADMPGVKAQDLKVDLRESVLTLTGRVVPPENGNETSVLREYQTGTFFRQFTLSETIDQPKIDAKLTDGVLRLELPKVDKARPRQITVRTE
ncbi:MAG TPA: Hsp20/alpha crystallin family protein [Myxococcaceae bacterium]|nr:Hsp20/alpha crystallin family protein [Myxococcaceae bacterium]